MKIAAFCSLSANLAVFGSTAMHPSVLSSSPHKSDSGTLGNGLKTNTIKAFSNTDLFLYYLQTNHNLFEDKHFTKLLYEHQNQVLWCFVNVQVRIGC